LAGAARALEPNTLSNIDEQPSGKLDLVHEGVVRFLRGLAEALRKRYNSFSPNAYCARQSRAEDVMTVMMTTWSRVEVAERMTAAEYWKVAPDEQKAELINGVLVMAPPPLHIHEKLYAFLFRLFGDYAEEHDLGEVHGSRTGVELASDQVYEPDLLFIAKDRLDIIQRHGVVGAPDLVIEILSASTAAYDRGDKLRTYERAGVRELWLVDPYGPAGTEFYQLADGRFLPIAPNAQGRLHSVALAGFWIDVTWLWPADRFITVRQALALIEAPSA
jgi:Uma2 family endonuclease